jgi:formiminotetrahydrofolate cyclodeaminase
MSFSDLPLRHFLRALASVQPTPGGGTAAAIGGAMGGSLLMMVSALPRTRGNTDDERATLATVRARLEPLGNALEECADRDAEAYDAVMAAYRLPKASDEEKAARRAAITSAMKGATEAPLETLRRAVEGLEAAEMVAALGNPSASSDVGVGVGLLAAAAQGAAANVRINLDKLADDAFKASASGETEALLQRAEAAQARARAVLA